MTKEAPIFSITEQLPEVKSNAELMEETKELQAIGLRAGKGALGLSRYRLGRPLKEVKKLLIEGYKFLDKDLEEDLKMIENPEYPILERVEKKYNPEKIISLAFNNQIENADKITSEEIKEIRSIVKEMKNLFEKLLKPSSQCISVPNDKIKELQVSLINIGQPYASRAIISSGQFQRSQPGSE